MLSSAFNIAAGGMLVASVATLPLMAFTSGRFTDWNYIDFAVILILFSAGFQGIAQIVLMQVKS